MCLVARLLPLLVAAAATVGVIRDWHPWLCVVALALALGRLADLEELEVTHE